MTYPSEECGCCEINDYAAPDDDSETACENCGHSPEDHEPDEDPDARYDLAPLRATVTITPLGDLLCRPNQCRSRKPTTS